MPGGEERILRRRIRSVEATKKITRAFELIAASQIVRAQGRIAGSRPYVEGIGKVLATTASETSGASRLTGEPEQIHKVMLVVMVADRGLCGGYNSIALRTADRLIQAGEVQGRSYQLVTIGKKAQSFFRFRGRTIDHSYIQMTDRPTFDNAREVASEVIGAFMRADVDIVQLISWRFRSAGVQTIDTRQILPLPTTDDVEPEPTPDHATEEEGSSAGYYDFEPEPEELLKLLVPQYAEAILYQALLEASASEHTARQRAMKAATEAADDFITTLRRSMNRVRQEAITTEIMEIVGGSEALRQVGPKEYVDIDANHTEEQIA